MGDPTIRRRASRSILRLVLWAATLAWMVLTLSPNAQASPWTIRQDLVPEGTRKSLVERYPSIRHATDLENLLRDIARRHPLKRLEATLVSGVWVISGSSATTVTDVDVQVTTRLLRKPLEAALNQFIGQVDAPENRQKIVSNSMRYMRRRGYPKAQIDLETKDRNQGMVYELRVTEGSPCIISRIDFGFPLPKDVGLDVTRGSLCDLEALESAVSNLEISLRDKGYNQIKIQLGDLNYDLDRDTATVRIEGILGQRIRYEVIDQTKRFLIDDLFGDDELTKIDSTIVDPDAMGMELARRYRQRGYIDVSITGPEVRQSGQDEFIYSYHVDPGRQYTLKEVKIEGAAALTQVEILEIMNLRSFWQASRPVNYEEIQAGINALKARYQQIGYWDIRIQDPGMGQRDKVSGTVSLVIQVNEGAQRILDGVTVTGNEALSQEEILDLLETPNGAPLDRAKLVDIQQSLRAAYMARGYLYSENRIDLKAREEGRRIRVHIDLVVEEGPRVFIGNITVVGLARTKEKVVRRELLFAEGDWYDPSKIAKSRQALTSLGIFSSVQINPADRNALAGREKRIDLTVEVQEGQAGNVAFGPGWSYVKGWNYVAEASYSNIGGVGRQASVRGMISEEKDQEAIGRKTLLGRRVGAGYTEPFILNYPVDGRLKATHRAEWIGDLWSLRFGGEFELAYKLRLFIPRSSVSAFYGQEVAKTEGSRTKEDQLVASDVRIGTIGTRFSIDRRNDPKFPTGGSTLDLQLAWARYEFGGDLRYFRWDIGFNKFFPLWPSWAFAAGINLTSYEDIQRKGELVSVLPPSERLFSGGADTVRGYKPQSLGPLVISPSFEQDADTGVCNVSYTKARLQGSARTTIKTELRYKWNEDTAVTFFVDNGNVFLSPDQAAKFEAAYQEPATIPETIPEQDPCRQLGLKNRLDDNFPYRFHQLVTKPKMIWDKHFFAYGLAYNRLTPIGSINFAYGLPWREPKTTACRADKEECHFRGDKGGPWIARGEFHINVGAQF